MDREFCEINFKNCIFWNFSMLRLSPKLVKKWLYLYQNMRRKISKKKCIVLVALFVGVLVIYCLYQWKIICSNSSIQKTIGMYTKIRKNLEIWKFYNKSTLWILKRNSDTEFLSLHMCSAFSHCNVIFPILFKFSLIEFVNR